MMSVLREKISKGKQGFIERVIDPHWTRSYTLQLLFLSDADKPC